MPQKLVIGPLPRGLKTDVEPFNVDNTNFPVLQNAYQWRGRVLRKRGTKTLGRLQRYFTTGIDGLTFTVGVNSTINLKTVFGLTTGTFIPGSVNIGYNSNIYTDPALDGILVGNPAGAGTINYFTGAVVLPNGAVPNGTLFGIGFYPLLPVMGFEDLRLNFSMDPGTISFDTTYAYNVNNTFPFSITDVSFYKNPAVDGSNLPTYVPKTTWTPLTWNGEDYQQFWTTNYEGAFWATNGINVPFNPENIGMQFKAITTVSVTSGTTANLTIAGHGLVIGDFLFINEVLTTTGINFQTGYVTGVPDANTVTVKFPFASLATSGSGGIAQYLTNRSDVTKDCIRWYDGSPTDGQLPPTFQPGNGWVNYMPPLSQFAYSIAGLPQAIYYLVGARMILPFKDRLIFIGPVVQTSSGTPKYLQDTVIFTQNGTPFYTASYTNTPSATVDTPTSVRNVFHPILVPANLSASPCTAFEDQVGFGGFIQAGVSDAITTASPNEDVIIMGFTKFQTRFVSTGNDVNPFEFFRVNSEYGSGSTFSTINMDEGVLSRGNRGYVITSQTGAQRIDLDILDQVFEINLDNNGSERFTAIRDFVNEWIYFTYTVNSDSSNFPNQTLFYNYRDSSYAIFNECFTTYGTWNPVGGYTWATLPYETWREWDSTWDAGDSTDEQLEVVGGNQQGFLIRRDEGTEEADSLYILDISGNTVTSPDHCLNLGDYIVINDATGTVSSIVNGNIYSVTNVDANTFQLNPAISGSFTYVGGGVIKRLYTPFVQTKQFPTAWGDGRKVRIGPQKYLLTKTALGQITVQIYLSQDPDNPYNNGTIVPDVNAENTGLIFSQTVYTCPESTNLGLTPFNSNLQSPIAITQSQIWHRMNTSLIGDTVQLGFTLSDAQMRDNNSNTAEIELHGFILEVSPSQLLC